MTVLPFQTWLGSTTTSGNTVRTWKINTNNPPSTYLTAFTALNNNGSTHGITTFGFYERSGASHPWFLPFLGGDQISSVTLQLSSLGEGQKGAVFFLTFHAPFTVASGVSQLDLDSLPKRAMVVYDTRTGAVKHLHQVSSFPGVTLPDVQALEIEALNLAGQLIKEPFQAAALPVDPDFIKKGGQYEVDLVSKAIREIPA